MSRLLLYVQFVTNKKENNMSKRIINAKPHLEPFLKEGEKFQIGFGSKSLTTDGLAYKDLTELIKANISEVLLMGRKGPLKENTTGKFVRKQPENKHQVLKHIKYTRKDGANIEYDRIFEVWEKEMLHKFGLKLYRGVSPQNEILLLFKEMEFNSSDSMGLFKAKAAMNMAYFLGGHFQLYDENLNPLLKITSTFDRKLLNKGYGTVSEKLEVIKEEYFGKGTPSDDTGNSYRFSVLKEFNITDIFDGEGGFNEYLLFEFAEDNIAILENLRSGNATFVFDLSKYDKQKSLDKATAKQHESFKVRIVHTNIDRWRDILSGFLKKKDEDDKIFMLNE